MSPSDARSNRSQLLSRAPGVQINSSRRGGFTLIELIAVVVIVGVMVALTATQLDFLVPKYRLRAAAREVAGAFKLGQARAAATGKDVFVEMDLSDGRYWLLVAFPKEKEEGQADPVEARGMEYQPIFERTLPEGVEFWDVVFGPKEKVDRGRTRARLSPFG